MYFSLSSGNLLQDRARNCFYGLMKHPLQSLHGAHYIVQQCPVSPAGQPQEGLWFLAVLASELLPRAEERIAPSLAVERRHWLPSLGTGGAASMASFVCGPRAPLQGLSDRAQPSNPQSSMALSTVLQGL